MSVYKNHPGDETYSYDFEVGGHRFRGDTREGSKREALRAQAVAKDKARADLKAARAARGGPMQFVEGAALYIEQVGAHHVNSDTTIANLQWLERHIGRTTLFTDINDKLVATLVALRRAEFRQVGKPENRTKRVSNATVNRTMTEPLRKVMLHLAAQDVPIGKVKWGNHILPETGERVREATVLEERDIMAQLAPGYDDAVRFSFLNGCRRMEVVGLKKTAVDFFGRQFTVLGKRGKLRTIPMSDDTFDLLWSLKDHPTEWVFTYVARRTDRRKGIIKGERYPMTEAGLKTAMRRAVPRAGVTNFHYHDTRHTAATRTLRKSNLRVVQILLGHEDVATTTKYAHALAEDVRAALNAASPRKNPRKGGKHVAK